ncbi:hypothetical protein [Methylobacterium sp. WL7]|uniref:hypothetical protein n=1 Tax=Methylobacterium sp. WL7 TaxID=2603900 RepID=UPI0011C798A4|nr:hypothetical protein [Methylobacterium sp. WL7]TXN43862.1 hypothetical protein FV233_16795 [Methylobacterium sp. WL7]
MPDHRRALLGEIRDQAVGVRHGLDRTLGPEERRENLRAAQAVDHLGRANEDEVGVDPAGHLDDAKPELRKAGEGLVSGDPARASGDGRAGLGRRHVEGVVSDHGVVERQAGPPERLEASGYPLDLGAGQAVRERRAGESTKHRTTRVHLRIAHPHVRGRRRGRRFALRMPCRFNDLPASVRTAPHGAGESSLSGRLNKSLR